MHRSRIALCLLAASLVSATALAGPVAEHRGSGPTTVSGTYSITFNLTIVSTLPANATITCKAQIAPANAAVSSFQQQSSVPFESAAGVATLTGSTATCTVEIPFSWTVEGTRGGVSLSYELDGLNASGSLPAVVRTSVQQNVAQPYPSSGATSTVTFNVTF